MNLFAAFQSEVFRPLVTLLIPGAFGISSWTLFLFWKYPRLVELAFNHRIEAATIFFFLVPAAGMLIEDVGARFETYRDNKLDKTAPLGEHSRIWYDYLRTVYDKDPIGRGYIRSVVLRLKFELGIAIASVVTIFGIAALCFVGLATGRALVFVFLLVALSAYEWWEAYKSHKLLAHTRKELLKQESISASASQA